ATVTAPTTLFTTFNVTSTTAGGLRFPTLDGLGYPGALGYLCYVETTDNHYLYGQLSAAWLAANGTTDCQYPDLHALDGWQPEWGIPDTAAIDDGYARAVAGNVSYPEGVKTETDYRRFVLPDGGWVAVLDNMNPE
ncbi:MAG: hypothetical protein ACYC7E_22275, partial [Armatimonadota bacterium]